MAAGLGANDARLYLAYGRALNRTNRPTDAIAALKTSLRIAPALDDARFELAVTLVRTGRDREALQEFHQLQKLGPEYAYRYFYNLAVAHARLGDTAQTRRLIEKARPQTRNPEELADLDRLLHSLDSPR